MIPQTLTAPEAGANGDARPSDSNSGWFTDKVRRYFTPTRLMRDQAAPLGRSLSPTGSNGGALDADSLDPNDPIVIAFVGMAFEAKIAAGPGVLVFSRSARRELMAMTKDAVRQGYRGMISFGVAGGLAADLRTGDWVVASTVLDSQSAHKTDAAWSGKLLEAIAGAKHAPIMGVDVPVAEPAMKRDLHRRTGAAAVDMESHMVSWLAAAHGLAFASVRVIVDPADRVVPPAAVLGMGADGRTDISAMVRDLVARPSQLPPLARIAADAFVARAELQRVRRLLGSHFGLLELA